MEKNINENKTLDENSLEDETIVKNEEQEKTATNAEDENIVSLDNQSSQSEDDSIEEVSNEEKLQEKIDELNDKLIRLMAEFENYRKRNEKEKNDMFDMGFGAAITKILPVIDSFERGLDSIQDIESEAYEGFTKIYKQFESALESANVKPIQALNQEFDVNLHNAIMHEEDDTKGKNLVVEELQKGYTYKEKVLRYSLVKVVN